MSDFKSWSVDEVGLWLNRCLGLDLDLKPWTKNGVDGKELEYLEEDDL